MKRLRLAVLGAGHLGTIHARLARQHADVELRWVADPRPAARARVQAELNVETLADAAERVGEIDAAIIAVPSVHHAAVAAPLLRRGVHLLIEKPLATSAADAQEMADGARRSGSVVQVGHVERFNPAWTAAARDLRHPRYIEACRTSGYTFRSTDIGAVFDLMIHDLDLVASLVDAPLVSVQALGHALLSRDEDMAQARLEFAGGCVANLSAARCHFEAQRVVQVVSPRGYTRIDLQQLAIERIRPSAAARRLAEADPDEGQKQRIRETLFQEWLPRSSETVERGNAILAEQRDWLDAIAAGRTPRVGIAAGLRAVEWAEAIVRAIARQPQPWARPAPAAPNRSARRAA